MTRPLTRRALDLLTSSQPYLTWDALQTRAYLKGLEDIDDAIVYAAAVQLQKGLKFMPTVQEIREACARIVYERRQLAVLQAEALQAHCGICTGSGWAETTLADGTSAVKRCQCWTQGRALIRSAGAPIVRPVPPALPAADEEPS